MTELFLYHVTSIWRIKATKNKTNNGFILWISLAAVVVVMSQSVLVQSPVFRNMVTCCIALSP